MSNNLKIIAMVSAKFLKNSARMDEALGLNSFDNFNARGSNLRLSPDYEILAKECKPSDQKDPTHKKEASFKKNADT